MRQTSDRCSVMITWKSARIGHVALELDVLPIRHNVRRITYVSHVQSCPLFHADGGERHRQNKEQGRLENAGLVMEEILNLPDSIPQDLLNRAECVIVVPSMTKAAIGIGYGRGAMVCRSGASFDGVWGSPAMYALEGGSFGLQLGAQSTDLVLLVMKLAVSRRS